MPEHQQIQQSKKKNTIFQKQATPISQTPVSNPYSIIQRAKINPKSLTHADIMQLQRTIGNQAVGRLLSSIGTSSKAQQATVQRQEIPEKEETCPSCMQRQEIPEEEEPLQGKMAETVQRQEIPEEEEPLQGKFESIQCQEIPEEEEPLQGKFENKPEIACPSCFAAPIMQKQEIPEEEEPLQGKMIGTVQRQEIPEEEPLQPKSENNTGMPDNLKAGVENLSGIDMSDVRVHYDSTKPTEVGALAYTQGADIHVATGQEKHLPHEAWHVVQQAQSRVKPTMQLKDGILVNDNEGLEHEADIMGERAFTSERNVFFRHGAYEKGSREGQELIAHKLTPVVQQTGNTVSRTLQQSKFLRHDEFDIIQRQFNPVTINSNAHLRNDGVWGTYVGDRINAGSEIVVDQAQQRTERHRSGSDTTWTKAVNVTGEDWDWNAHNGNTTYIRKSRIGAAKHYPQQAGDYKLADRDKDIEKPKLKWHHLTGEFVEIEDSVSTVNTKIAHHKHTYKRINPTTGQVAPLDADEKLQLAFEDYLKARVRAILTNETIGMAWQNQLVTDRNILKVMMTGDETDGGSKSLRWDGFGNKLSGEDFVAYYKWVTDPNGPFHRIQEGANYARDSLEHWRKWLFPPHGTDVTITSLSLSGSDLHELGLGVMFVTFNKATEGGNSDYYDAGDHQIVVKPEERILEQKLFGTQDDSLAKTVNTGVGLAGPDQITTYKQKIDAGFGTLCERVVGTRANDLPKDQVRPITQALKESLVFVLITGLTDLNGENILWNNGKPYLIDADNALNLKFMKPGTAKAQTGYTAYGAKNDVLRAVYASSAGYGTAMLQALRNPGTPEQKKLLLKVKQIFSGSQGRVVPVKTRTWGSWMQSYITIPRAGSPADLLTPLTPTPTRWGCCNYLASKVPAGFQDTLGLRGEAGVREGTDGNFQRDVEEAQIYADFKLGQIPFYNYKYETGNVLHNGQVIWNGQTVTERMAGLFALFPNQIDV